MGRGLLSFILAASTPKLELSISLSFTQELRFGTLVPAPMGCSNRYCLTLHIIGIKQQHLITIKPAEEVSSARLHPADDRSTMVLIKAVLHGAKWLPVDLVCSLFTLLKSKLQTVTSISPSGRGCLSCSQEEEQYGCGGEKERNKNEWEKHGCKIGFQSSGITNPAHTIPCYFPVAGR